MLSEQEQTNILQPFQVLVVKFGSALGAAKQTLDEWENARTIKATSRGVGHNDELSEKIRLLEEGKSNVESVVSTVTQRSKMPGADFTKMVKEVEISARHL